MKDRINYLKVFAVLTLFVSGILFIAGCSKKDTLVSNPTPSEPPQNEIWISGNSFIPADRLIQLSGTDPGQVTWRNKDEIDHRIVSGTVANPDSLFDSGDIPPGGTFTYTYSAPGVYYYHCSIHDKDGSLTVQ